MDLREAYAYCKSVIDRHSSTFSVAFASLPASDSRAVWAVYAFCRCVDDLVDEGELSLDDRLKNIDDFHWAFHHMTESAAQAKYPLFIALSDVFERYPMKRDPFEAMILGQRMDLRFESPRTLEQLETYCYYVAGTVGLMLLPILGNSTPDLEQRVVSLGIAMQLTNILRDVTEDAERGRIYIPSAMMEEHRVTKGQIVAGIWTEEWESLAATIGKRAEELYRIGLGAAPAFGRASRQAVLVAGEMYRAILTQIRAEGYQVFGVRHYVDATQRKRLLEKLFQTHGKNGDPLETPTEDLHVGHEQA